LFTITANRSAEIVGIAETTVRVRMLCARKELARLAAVVEEATHPRDFCIVRVSDNSIELSS
jgi:hypothetical protein